MNALEKKRLLNRFKKIATGLFFGMFALFLITLFIQKHYGDSFTIGAIHAFSEAAMVGALADWFAVTALFRHPMGLPIPHTNLIEKSKQKLGDNLGGFVVTHFLSPKNIKPYIKKLNISLWVSSWLTKEKNQDLTVEKLCTFALPLLEKVKDDEAAVFIKNTLRDLVNGIAIEKLAADGLHFLVEKNEHQTVITSLSREVKEYIEKNRAVILDKVNQSSYAWVPSFVDKKIAEKITNGMVGFLDDVENNLSHEVRAKISDQLLSFSKELHQNPYWKDRFLAFSEELLNHEKATEFSNQIWQNMKKSISAQLSDDSSSLKNYIKNSIKERALNIKEDPLLQIKIDLWVQTLAYKMILQNTHHFGALISTTMGNWKGNDLSEKIELEVGKDLQFIRINGTLVGGLVGLVLYLLTVAFS